MKDALGPAGGGFGLLFGRLVLKQSRPLIGAFPSTSNSNALVIKDPAITLSDTDPNQTQGQLKVPVAPL